ncbi:MAG: hypothetical protein AAFY45_23755 [Bacteroidota bacterium]
MGYYKHIDGQKFDRALLELAESMVAEKGDGRISLKDAKKISEAVFDQQGATEIERDTIRYIKENLNWTDAAKSWFADYASVLDKDNFNERINWIKRSMDLSGLELKTNSYVVESMNNDFPSEISFFKAFERAIHAVLTIHKRNTPRYEIEIIINNVYDIYEEDFKQADKWSIFLQNFLKERMRNGFLALIPTWEEVPNPEDQIDYFPPDREATKDHWNFFLGIETDDHQFWVIVPRTEDKEPYIYGYN